jgi:RsiW-degrading membrane proteinase PrsW (M82 family)
MPLHTIKLSLAAAWVASSIVLGLFLGVTSGAGQVAMAALGLLPPLGVLFLWNEPKTTRDSIRDPHR